MKTTRSAAIKLLGPGGSIMFITGPGLKANGSQIQSPELPQYEVVNGDPTTFQKVTVLGDTTWKWTWRTSEVTLAPGVYTIYAVSQPYDKPTAIQSTAAYGTVSITISSSAVLPLADFTTNITYGNAPVAISFFDTSTHSPTAWWWNFGDGTFSTEQNPVHVYASTGVYTV
ncbi:MAG: hypothetical protein STSR0009_00370 [Methanoregula sp.]